MPRQPPAKSRASLASSSASWGCCRMPFTSASPCASLRSQTGSLLTSATALTGSPPCASACPCAAVCTTVAAPPRMPWHTTIFTCAPVVRKPPPPPLQGRRNREGPEETVHGERDEQGGITGQDRPCSPKTVQSAEGGKGNERERIIVVVRSPCQMHTPARTCQWWSRQTRHGLGVCIWMHLVNGTGNSPSPGQPTLE